MMKSKVSALLSLLLVFLSGSLVGALAHRLYMVNTVQSVPKRPSPEEFRKRYMEDFRSSVKLDEQQSQQVEQVLDAIGKEFHQLRDKQEAEGQKLQAEQVEKINALLSEEQRTLYTQFRAKREAMRKQRRQGGPPGPPPK